MIPTANLRRQHDALLSLAKELRALSGRLATHDDAVLASRTLAKITGLLKMHLVVEDEFLYPSMVNCEDRDVAHLAARFSEEMGGLGEAFFAFVDKWNSAVKILEGSKQFNAEYSGIFAALASRIERENNELYPAAEKLSYVPG